MRKILMCMFFGFCFVGAFAASTTKMYIGTEQKYIFTAENLAQTIPEFVEDEKKQEKMADTYTRVMNQETGAVSVANLFEVCRAGGFNTYRQTGYDQCRGFILKLLENAEQEIEEGFLSGFCPAAYDENEKQQNGLRSIDENTRIGDFCSSTNIAGGEVVFRKGYNCTCAAYACNPGFQSEKGACVTEYKDSNGDCIRKEYTNVTTVTKAEEALTFCESKAVKGCKVRNAIRNFGGVKGRVVCNATRDEVDNTKARMLDQQDKQIARLKYYDVCRDYKGKTGKQEYCIDKLFKGLDVGLNEAAGLAQLYATEKNGHTIYCDPSHNKKTIDDYFNCSTLDKSVYYTFRFDDTVETNDAKKFRNTVRGIALIYGLREIANNTIAGACTTKLQNAAKRFGMKAQTSNNSCVFDYGIKTDNKNLDSTLRTIDGIDNYVFYHEIQLRGSTRLRDNLKQYVKDQGFVITAFDCDNSYGRIKKRFIEGDDETLTCRLSGTRNGTRYTNQPVDFVFDDLSESRKTTREAGEAGMTCIISGGAYANKNCHGLDQNQCSQVNAKLKAENPKSSGTKWQNGQCVLIDVKEQNRLENGIQIGLSIIALADCATVVIGNAQGVMGCTLAVVEITGLATELTTGAAMQQRADDFIKIAVACNNRSCAKNTLKTMAGKAITVQDALKSASTAHQIDVHLARLVEYLEPEDLQSEVAPNDWDDIVRQLGGDPNDTAGRALKVANKIGFIAQFASLGASALRLTGRAIAKIAAKSATKTAVSGTKALVVAGAHADDAASAFAKAAEHADDAARAANNATDAARGVSNGAKTADRVRDVIYDAAYFSRNSSSSDDVFRGVDDIVQINRKEMSAATLRDLMRKAKQYGFECTDCGGDILKFSKSADNASDAARAAGNAADAARGASKADDVADATKGAGKTTSGATTGASTATRGATKVDDVADASRTAQRTSDIAKKNAGQIIQESKKMTYAERQSLFAALSPEKKLEIAKLKVGAGEVKLPFGSTVDDLAKNPDLLELSGEYIPLNQQALNLRGQINRFDKLAEKAKTTGLSTDELTEYNNVLKNGGRESLVSELRYTLSNDISLDALVANGQQYESALIGVVTSDPKMVRQAQNFSKLTKAEQQTFLNNVVKGLDDYFQAGVKPKVQLVDSWTEIGLPAEKDISGIGLTRGNTIYIKPSNLHLNGMDGDLNNVMSLIAHEYGHAMDGAAAEKVAIGGNAMGKSVIGNPGNKVAKTLKDNMEYVATPTERSSHAISTVVGENFAKDLENTLKTGKVTTSSLTDLQKYKIMTGFVGDKIKTTEKFGMKFYAVPSKSVDNLETVMDHFRKLGVENMTIFEENGEHVLAVFDKASDMKRFEQQIAKATKVTSKVDDVDDITRKTEDVYQTVNKFEDRAIGRLNREKDVASTYRLRMDETTIDDTILEYQMKYVEDAEKAVNNLAEEKAWLKYHQRMVDYLATKFDRPKTIKVAKQRRQTYMEIIANDKDLSDKALKWKTLSGTQKEDFMNTLINRANRVHCNGHSCTVNVNYEAAGGATNWGTGDVDISLSSGVVYNSSGGCTHIKPNQSLDDAMTAFAHEHAHSITAKAPEQSSIDERWIGYALNHMEQPGGVTAGLKYDEMGNIIKDAKGNPIRPIADQENYRKTLLEQEGFLIGETVGKNFEQDLRRMIK